jgi:L-fuculose-phosphate aldolase
MDERSTRDAVLDASRRAVAARLNHGSSGNISVRFGEGFFVTPSAMSVDEMCSEDLVYLPFVGEPVGRRRPSSESPFHRAIYLARPDVAAVVHAHSPAAVALSTLRRGIPAFHYMVALAGGPVRCTAYAPFGSDELARLAVDGLLDRQATLLGHHGQIALGANLREALDMAIEVEALADQYLRAAAVREPDLLDDEQMADALRRFAAYRAPQPR